MKTRRPRSKGLWRAKGQISSERARKAGLVRALWGLAGLAVVLLAMSMLSGRLGASRPADESMAPVAEESGHGGATGIDGEAESKPSPADAAPAITGGGWRQENASGGTVEVGSGKAISGMPGEGAVGEGVDLETAYAPGEAFTPDDSVGEERDCPSPQGYGDSMPDLGASLIKVVFSLGVVVFLVLATRAYLKRSRFRESRANGDNFLRVLGYTRLGNGTGVHEVQVGERIWFIGEGERELRLLGEFDLSELELARLAKEAGDEGGFSRELEGNLTAGMGEWSGTVPRGWLNALRWKTAR